MIGYGARDCMRKIGIVNRTLRVSAKVIDAMTEACEKALQFFFHRKASVVGAPRDRLMLIRSATRHGAHNFDPAFVHDVGREWRQTGALSDAQNLAALKTADIIFGNDEFGGF